MHMTVAYSQEKERVTMEIRYDGEYFDPMESDNILSVKLARNAAESIQYSQIDEDGYTNLVVANIK